MDLRLNEDQITTQRMARELATDCVKTTIGKMPLGVPMGPPPERVS